MPARTTLLFIFVLIFACKPNKPTDHPLLNYVPDEASLIIKINNLSTLQSELKNNSFINDAAQSETIKKFKAVFGVLNHIQTDSTNLLALVENDTPHIFLISHTRPSWSINGDSINPVNKLKGAVQKSAIGDIPVFTLEENGIHILSTSEDLVRTSLNANPKLAGNELLSNLYKT
ncbi:MAG: hypothetical protein ACR2MM_07135, partial [Flavobacteriaceae bacterium]